MNLIGWIVLVAWLLVIASIPLTLLLLQDHDDGLDGVED